MSAEETAVGPVQHRISWWVYAWNGSGRHEKMRHAANMRGTWGWDAACSCGWESSTGGATRGSVRRMVDDHKWDVGTHRLLHLVPK